MSIPSYPWVISKYKYPVCGCEQEQSRQWPWCHLGEWWQWSLLLASTGPGRLEAGGREDPDWTLVGAAGARGDHRHPASCVILSYCHILPWQLTSIYSSYCYFVTVWRGILFVYWRRISVKHILFTYHDLLLQSSIGLMITKKIKCLIEWNFLT